MTRIKYDLSEQDPDASVQVQTRESPKPGMYVATINEIKARDAQGDPDKPMLEVILEISDADKKANKKYAGARLWWYVMLPDHPSFADTAWKLDQLLQATGVATGRKRKGVFDPDSLVGQEVMVNVRGGKNQDGEYKGDVGAVLAYDEDSWGAEGSVDDEDESFDEEELEDTEEEDLEEESEGGMDYSTLSIKELRDEMESRDLDHDGLRKSDMVAVLEEDDELNEDEGAEPDEEEEEDEEPDEPDEEEEEDDEPAPKARRKPAAKRATRKPAARKTAARKPAAKRTGRKSAAKSTAGRRGKRSDFPFDE